MTVVDFDKAAVLSAFFSSLVFLIGYSFLAPWWRHPIGVSMASLDAGLAIALLPGTLHQLTGLSLSSVFFAWYYGASLFLVAGITLWRLVVILAVQRDAHLAAAQSAVDEP
jgi:hypothetical protein